MQRCPSYLTARYQFEKAMYALQPLMHVHLLQQWLISIMQLVMTCSRVMYNPFLVFVNVKSGLKVVQSRHQHYDPLEVPEALLHSGLPVLAWLLILRVSHIPVSLHL
jgi:hypothetical protein